MSNLLSRSIIFSLCFFFSLANAVAQEENQSSTTYKNTIGGSFSLNSAQNNRNLIIVQGNLFDNLTRSNSFNFSPYYIRAIRANLKVGLMLNYSVSTFESVSPTFFTPVFPTQEPLPIDEQTNSSISNYRNVGGWIFARSKMKQFNKFHIFTEPMIGIENSTNDTKGLNWQVSETGVDLVQQLTRNERITNLLNIRINFGIGYTLSPRWNLITRFGNLSYSTGSVEEYYSVSTGGFTTFTDSSKVDVSEFNLNFRPSNFSIGLEYNF